MVDLSEQGYDTDIFDTAPDQDFVCAICAGVARNAVETQCAHLFCEGCINLWLQKSKTCPIDREQIDPSNIRPALYVQRKINTLKIKCACSEMHMVKDLEEHKKHCRVKTHKCEVCGTSVRKVLLDAHVADALSDHFRIVCEKNQRLEDKVVRLEETIRKIEKQLKGAEEERKADRYNLHQISGNIELDKDNPADEEKGNPPQSSRSLQRLIQPQIPSRRAKPKKNFRSPNMLKRLSIVQIQKLRKDDFIEFRDRVGKWVQAQIEDTDVFEGGLKRAFIHFIRWPRKWDTWVDIQQADGRFAEYGCLAPANDGDIQTPFDIGDLVDVHPPLWIYPEREWTHGTIRKVDMLQLQVQFRDKYVHKKRLLWFHCFDDDEIATFGTHTSGEKIIS